MGKYYTYTYLRKDGTPYYIGKGCGKRMHDKNHSVKLPPKWRRIYLKQNLTEDEAHRHEIYMIYVLGRKEYGGILRNLTDGGEGTSGRVESISSGKERGKLISIGWKSNSLEKKTKISNNKMMNNTQRHQILVDGILFPSKNAAARYAMKEYIVSRNTALRYIKEGRDFTDKKRQNMRYGGNYTSSKYIR